MLQSFYRRVSSFSFWRHNYHRRVFHGMVSYMVLWWCHQLTNALNSALRMAPTLAPELVEIPPRAGGRRSSGALTATRFTLRFTIQPKQGSAQKLTSSFSQKTKEEKGGASSPARQLLLGSRLVGEVEHPEDWSEVLKPGRVKFLDDEKDYSNQLILTC